MEYQDIVDDNDNIIGVDTRENIWKKGIEHQTRAVNVWVITNSGKLVVPIRSMSKQNWPGCFDFSCGESVISGENYDQAVKRGLNEELGITDLTSLKLLGKLSPKDGVFCFMKVYSVSIPDNFKLKLDEYEFSEVRLFSIEEFNKLTENREKFKRGVVEVWKMFEDKITNKP